jgi:hypothetical protein
MRGTNSRRAMIRRRNTMLIKLALAAVLALGVASVAQAGSKDDNGGYYQGGYHIGPLGQWFGGPVYRWRGYRGYYGPYAFVPRYRYHRYWRYEP